MRRSGQPSSHTCCRGNLQIRWLLCACRQVCPGPVLHPAPVSATPFCGREAPVAPSLAPVDGLLPSALAQIRGHAGDGVNQMKAPEMVSG